MSTRAIIGIKYSDNHIIGAWQWNDGDGLTDILNKYFNTLEKALTLINAGMWGAMYTLREKIKTENLYKKMQIPSREFICVEGVYLSTNKHYRNRLPVVYENYEEMAGQDINHTYLFDNVQKKWVKDSDIKESELRFPSFTELNQFYGLDDDLTTRDDLGEELERAYVEDCFCTYEYIGFTDSFHAVYNDKQYEGMKFTVLGRVQEITNDQQGADLECLPMWKIRFENGEEFDAFPEEICIEEIRKWRN